MRQSAVNIICGDDCVRKKEFKTEPDVFKGSVIELRENREAIVDGCRYVINYDENGIELRLEGICIRFKGMKLKMSSLVFGQAVIMGEIAGIEFFSI